MFKHHDIQRGENINVFVSPITSLKTQKSDKENGYYIVSGFWGTCFHRIAKNKHNFEIHANCNPRCAHTYTKIPLSLADKVFFVYVNYKSGYKIIMPAGACVVGMSQSQPHKIGGWWSQTCLIYSPLGECPAVETDCECVSPPDAIRFVRGGKDFLIDINKITLGFECRFIDVNEEGFVKLGRQKEEL
jgi:hypothetical protein